MWSKLLLLSLAFAALASGHIVPSMDDGGQYYDENDINEHAEMQMADPSNCPKCGVDERRVSSTSCKCVRKRNGIFHGDMKAGNNRDYINKLFGIENGNDGLFRGLTSNARFFWPASNDGKVYVPYVFEGLGSANRASVGQAIADFNSRTCIRFVTRQNQRDYIRFTQEPSGCFAYVGRNGNGQQLNLAPGCAVKGIAIHEMMHAIGFFHEQSRPDRDQYVEIRDENIRPAARRNFEKKAQSEIDSLGSPYDYNSIMHYGPRAFSQNGQDTIVTKDPNASIGQRAGMSVEDLAQINKRYCGGGTINPQSTTTTTSTARPTAPPASCTNQWRDSSCEYYKSKGYCSYSQLKALCQKSCAQCESGDCANTYSDTHCDNLQRAGYCSFNSIKNLCKKACGNCNGDDFKAPRMDTEVLLDLLSEEE